MDLTEKLKESQTIFSGRMLTLKLDKVVLPDGKEADREWVVHPGAVAVLAVDQQDRICLVRQYRYPVGKEMLEIPAGKLTPGEDPLECARRELLEETGFTAAEWRLLYTYYTTPGFTNEIMHIYLASGLSGGEATPDEDEFLEVDMINARECWDMIRSGKIQDGKTLVALLHFFLQRGGL